MKRALYDLTDEEFAYFVSKVDEQLNEKGMKYILVGGTAVQAHVLKRLCHKNGKYLEELILDPNIRIQDHIRATDDIDLAIDSSVNQTNGEFGFERKIKEVFDGITGTYLSPSEEHIFEYNLARSGMKRPVFQIHVDDETGDDKRISLNIGRKPSDLYNLDDSNYDKFIDEGQIIEIPYSPKFNLKARVIKPEHLIASKATKFRAKDTMDIYSVADSIYQNKETINVDEIKKLLYPKYEENFDRLLDLAKLKDLREES